MHLSAMDLFRNFDRNLAGESLEFDAFAPGWQAKVTCGMSKDERRRAAIDHWKSLVDAMGMDARAEMRAIKNSTNRDLYWLLLVSRHGLAKKFWSMALKASNPQQKLL